MVLAANLIISIERMQSGIQRSEGGREPEGGGGRQKSGLGVWSLNVCPFTRGYQGDPCLQTTTSANERQGPVPADFDR